MRTKPDDGGVLVRAQIAKGEYVSVGATVRIASAVAGGSLTMFGLRRRGKAGYGMALLGAGLLYRGASGHCKTYSVLGVSTKEYVEPGVPADPAGATCLSRWKPSSPPEGRVQQD